VLLAVISPSNFQKAEIIARSFEAMPAFFPKSGKTERLKAQNPAFRSPLPACIVPVFQTYDSSDQRNQELRQQDPL
jgi:hypothetical protein